MKVFIFSWNSQSICYEEKPNFIEKLWEEICKDNYTLLAFAFQEEASKSDLPKFIGETVNETYELIDSTQLLGWGVTTFKRLQQGEYVPRGLKLSLYKKRDSMLEIKSVRNSCILCPSLRDWITWGKGAVIVTLVTNLGIVTFINMHLPFYSRFNRDEALSWQSYCFNYLYGAALEEVAPNYLFIMGDLNFRVSLRNEPTAYEVAAKMFSSEGYLREMYQEGDELKLILDYAKLRGEIPVSEGVENRGPEFFPTCKLKHHRTGKEGVELYKLGTSYQRTPSWCDRILYKSNRTIQCYKYDRFDYGLMNLSDHAAVMGGFMI